MSQQPGITTWLSAIRMPTDVGSRCPAGSGQRNDRSAVESTAGERAYAKRDPEGFDGWSSSGGTTRLSAPNYTTSRDVTENRRAAYRPTRRRLVDAITR